ncbi:hypothetical protein BHS62_25810 [Salmonella enterica]|nr:hypothetical protein [Salmonella enterica]
MVWLPDNSSFIVTTLTVVTSGKHVPASELTAVMKQITELQFLPYKKTMENELPKEAVEYGRSKKWITTMST